MAVEVISFTPIELQNGAAVKFRTDLNTNFENIKTSIDSIKTNIDTINATLADGVGVDIRYSSVQPTDQKAGDYWFKILS